MSDGPWISIDDEWLNLSTAQDVDITSLDDSESYTLTITWDVDRSRSFRLDDEQKRDEITEVLDELLEPEALDVDEADVDVPFL